MYKFTNGIVVFDEKTRDDYLKAGYKLENDETKKLKKDMCQIGISFNEIKGELDENNSNDRTIEEKPRRSKKVSK